MTSEPITDFYAVIPAGGSGTRLWPVSRMANPKFLQALTGNGRSLLQSTVDRLAPLATPSKTLVVTGAAHGPAVGRQLPDIPVENILIEPAPKDSAPAIGLAAAIIARRDPDAIMGSFAADHRVCDPTAFIHATRSAIRAAQDGFLVSIGLTPTAPETGYGYIHQGERLESGAFGVREFKEKPARLVAESYLASGEYLWNASMFVWRVDVVLAELELQAPTLFAGLMEIAAAWDSPERESTMDQVWPTLPKIAIDYAVMEGAAARGRVATVPASIGWTDVGDWHTLGELLPKDDADNAVLSLDGQEQQVIAVDTRNSVLVPSVGRALAVIGMDNVVVVDTPDALLVCSRDRAQQVKSVVELLPPHGSHR